LERRRGARDPATDDQDLSIFHLSFSIFRLSFLSK